MVKVIGGYGSYTERRDINGKDVNQRVHRFVLATEHALVHFKQCDTGRFQRLFADLDTRGATTDRAKVQRHQQYSRCVRECARNGGSFTSIPFADTDELEHFSPTLAKLIQQDPRAKNAWAALIGDVDTNPFETIASKAEEIKQDQRQTYLQKKAVAMADVDPLWGIF